VTEGGGSRKTGSGEGSDWAISAGLAACMYGEEFAKIFRLIIVRSCIARAMECRAEKLL